MVRLLSRICPGCNGDPSVINSSPVDSTATRARLVTLTVRTLTLASTPATGGVTIVPGANSSVPARMSSPTPRSAVPGATCAPMRTRRPPSSRSVSSTITTASAPAGTGAPVMIRIASPGCSSWSEYAPAATSPTTASSTGTRATSALTTA